MRENKSGNRQMENGKGGRRQEGGKTEKILSGLAPLVNLWPAVLVAVLIAGTLPATEPVLREIPALLTIDAKASETKAAEETETDIEAETAPVQEIIPVVEEIFEEPEGYVDGTYYGSARGFGGTVQVKVLISEGKIADISIVSASGETPSYLSSAKAVISRIIAAQSPNVDIVSGATYSSNGIINAVKIALKQAAGSGVTDDLTVDEDSINTGGINTGGAGISAGNTSSPQKKPLVNKNPLPAEDGYMDGVYIGTAEGFGGEITVQVTVAGGKIVSIEILEAEDETPSYLKQAEKVTERIIAAQSTEVDVVSGATWSSTGIINAVSEALTKAVSAENGNPGSDSTHQSGLESTQQPEGGMENPGFGSWEDSEEGSSESSGSDQNSFETTEAENSTALYKDGVYRASALCADEDTFIYTVQVTVIIGKGKIADIQVEKLDDRSDYPDDNDVYLDYAINGRTRKNVWYEGVVKQILTAQNAEQIDVVSSATYSSNAIVSAAREALQTALAEASEDSEDAETQETVEETGGIEAPETDAETESPEVPEIAAETENPEVPETDAENESSAFSVFSALEILSGGFGHEI